MRHCNAVHEEKVGDLTIKIIPDEFANDPRDWGSLFGTMSFFHRRHDLGTPEKDAEAWFKEPDDLREFFRMQGSNVIRLPVYMYEHSGITLSCGPFSCPWDSGQLGYIWITKDQAKKEFMTRRGEKIKRFTKKQEKRTLELLQGTIKTMDQWITGDVYGWVVEDEDGEVLESVWGYWGCDEKDGSKNYILGEARSAADHIIYEAKKIAQMH